MQGSRQVFDGAEDPARATRRRHDLCEKPVIALSCMACGGRTCTDMAPFVRSKEAFLRRFMKLRARDSEL